MNAHAPEQKRQHDETAPQASVPGKVSRATSIGLPLFMQAKLSIGATDDPLELEADRVAEQILAAPSHPTASSASKRIQRFKGSPSGETNTAPASVVHVLASCGTPMEPALQRDMEQRFGQDFSAVRLHSDSSAKQSARDVNAHAYTVGRDIVFGAGQFEPGTQAGRRLLAHELTHVVQQSAGNRAAATLVQRQTGAEGGFKIISQVWRVSGRDIVVVATGHGDQVLYFYKRTGAGNKGVGVAPKPNSWVPFKTLMSQDEEILGAKAKPKNAWINKQPYYSQVGNQDPLRGYANARNQQVGQWLDEQNLPKGQVKHWEVVEQEMDDVANKYRQSVRGGAPSGGGAGGKAAGQVGAAEVKGAVTEAKAIGTEAKAASIEAKAIKAETAAADVVAGAAKATKAARLGRLLMALAMPGPHDVFFMFLSAFASIAEAKAKLRADAYALGFAQGLAAVITWTDAAKAERLLLYKVANPSIGERVAGFEGVREKGTNDGVMAGWKFGNALNGAQRKGFRAEALAATGLKEKRHSSRDDLIAMGIALRPTVIELLAEAERQERQKRLAEQWRLANLRPPM